MSRLIQGVILGFILGWCSCGLVFYYTYEEVPEVVESQQEETPAEIHYPPLDSGAINDLRRTK